MGGATAASPVSAGRRGQAAGREPGRVLSGAGRLRAEGPRRCRVGVLRGARGGKGAGPGPKRERAGLV